MIYGQVFQSQTPGSKIPSGAAWVSGRQLVWLGIVVLCVAVGGSSAQSPLPPLEVVPTQPPIPPMIPGPPPVIQPLTPAAPHCIGGVDCAANGPCVELGWDAWRPIPWQAYAQGEYVGHARLPHVPEYRLRVDDELDCVYRLTREETDVPYELNVGDEIRIESAADPALNRDLVIQPDGTISLRLLGEVEAAHRTVGQLREELEKAYGKFYQIPGISIIPLRVNTKLEDLRATVDARSGIEGGQVRRVRVTPEGTIALPAIGSLLAQGLTLEELKVEIDERYRQVVLGIEVTPILIQRAPRFVYVLGEVNLPGRFELTGPTTLMQAISMAGSWRVGGDLHRVIVFRRGDDWRLMATMVDLWNALHGHEPCPHGEIWLNDSDLVIIPPSRILVMDNFINLVFTRGIYGVIPFSASVTNNSAL